MTLSSSTNLPPRKEVRAEIPDYNYLIFGDAREEEVKRYAVSFRMKADQILNLNLTETCKKKASPCLCYEETALLYTS